MSASAVILPLPVTFDGINLNSESEDKIKLNTILDFCDVPIFGGKIEESFLHIAESRKKRVIDYFESETLQIRNAVPTAEGAISIAMQHLDKTIMNLRQMGLESDSTDHGLPRGSCRLWQDRSDAHGIAVANGSGRYCSGSKSPSACKC